MRDKFIKVRVSEQELEIIDNNAKRVGLVRSAFLRVKGLE